MPARRSGAGSGSPYDQPHRDDAGPGRPGDVGVGILRPVVGDLQRPLLDRQPEHEGGGQLLDRRLADLRDPPGQQRLGDQVESGALLVRVGDRLTRIRRAPRCGSASTTRTPIGPPRCRRASVTPSAVGAPVASRRIQPRTGRAVGEHESPSRAIAVGITTGMSVGLQREVADRGRVEQRVEVAHVRCEASSGSRVIWVRTMTEP